MGRRKIEIRAIKDDRNRSVTFLKRKGGLFKKAHELSVLCSVDVAVVIFGHNKKLYQFASGDINETLRRYQYYGPPHEHKGPADFKNKSGGDDEDEDEEDEEPNVTREDSLPPQHQMMPPHPQHHNAFQHIRPPGPSASPPMNNGMFHRNSSTPQPQHMGSRPSSRNTIRRSSSNLVPLQHPHATPPPQQNGFAYAPNPPIYNPQANIPQPQPSPQPQFQQFPQHATPQPHQQMQQPPQQQQQQQPPPPSQQQQQQQYMSEQRTHTPPIQSDQFQPPPQPPTTRVSPPPPQDFRQTELTPPQIKHLPSKSRSIFTPIDEGGSVLAQHFFGAPDPPRNIDGVKKENSPDMKRLARPGHAPPLARSAPQQPRPSSSLANEFRPPQRSDTNNSSKSGARPKLNLTIPSEASDGEPTSISPGQRSAVNSANPARLGGNGNGEHHNLILPPPSPSASAVLSAGASGPPNPFARPPPPTSQNNNAYSENRNNNLETPISALPSRYMDQDLLASPGGLFGSWANFSGGNAILPSPNVSTPLAERGLPNGFGRGEKREGEDLVGEAKRVKT